MAIRLAVALVLCASGFLCVSSSFALAQNKSKIGLVGMHIAHGKKAPAGTTKNRSRYVAGPSGGVWKQSAKPRKIGRKTNGMAVVRSAEF